MKQVISLVVGFFCLGLGQSQVFAQEKNKWLWEKLGDEVSRIVPGGKDSLERDFESRNNPAPGTTHVVTMGPIYLALSLIQTAFLPTTYPIDESQESTAASQVEAENEEIKKLKRENEELLKKQIELLEKLRNQAERFIESYNPDTQIGLLEPELKKYLGEVHGRVLALIQTAAQVSGANDKQALALAKRLSSKISDFDLASEFLRASNGEIESWLN